MKLNATLFFIISLGFILSSGCGYDNAKGLSGTNDESTISNFQLIEDATLVSMVTNAKHKKRPIFIGLHTDWCVKCRWVKEDLLRQPSTISFFRENLVSYWIDAETRNGAQIVEEYDIRAYPTFLYLTTEADEVTRYIGLTTSHNLVKMGKEATKEEEKIQKAKMRKKRRK